jgi:hypothetical protein
VRNSASFPASEPVGGAYDRFMNRASRYYLEVEAVRRAARGDVGLGAALAFLRRAASESALIGYLPRRDGALYFWADDGGSADPRRNPVRVTDACGKEQAWVASEASAMLDRRQAMGRLRLALAAEMHRRDRTRAISAQHAAAAWARPAMVSA